MPRLFTGLEIPGDVGFALSLKRGGLHGARWIDPSNYHITLRYIGDVDHRTAHEIVHELDRLSIEEPFDLTLSHLGVFGGKRPRALFAGVDPAPELMQLHDKQERGDAAIGTGAVWAQICAARHLGPAKRSIRKRYGAASATLRSVLSLAFPGCAVCALFCTRLHRWRTLFGGRSLSAGGLASLRSSNLPPPVAARPSPARPVVYYAPPSFALLTTPAPLPIGVTH